MQALDEKFLFFLLNRKRCVIIKKRGKMERYIQRINDKVILKHDEEGRQKIKKRYLYIGMPILIAGLVGFLASFITFIVLFLNYQTDAALTAWVIAVPFILMAVAGSVITRIGDQLLREGLSSKAQEKLKEDAVLKDKELEK